MKQRNDDSAAIEARERGFLAWGDGFYANRYATKASLESITRDDLVAFQRRWVHPRNVLVAVSGDFDRAAIVKKLDALFAAWPDPGRGASPPVPKPDHRMVARHLPRRQGRQPGARFHSPPGHLPRRPRLLRRAGHERRPRRRAASRAGSRTASARTRGSRIRPAPSSPAASGIPDIWRAAFQSKVRTAAYAAQIVLEEMTEGCGTQGVTDEELADGEGLVRRHASRGASRRRRRSSRPFSTRSSPAGTGPTRPTSRTTAPTSRR